MATIHVTADNFETEVLKAEQPVLVDFFATWCGPCQMVGPIVEQLSEEVPTVKFAKVNVEEAPEVAKQFHVSAVPTFVLVKNGQAVKTEEGALPKAALKKMLEE